MEVADAGEKLDAKPVDLGGLRMFVDPRQEWRQIFDEAWRMEQQFFYDPNMHGLDWRAVRARYEPLLEFVQRREDLNDLLIEMIGEMQVGHNRISGGDLDSERPAGIGLLGADFKVENNLYRIQRIYRGDRWNPFLVGPLAAAGVNAAEGDAILAINGHALDGRVNIFSLLEGTVDKQVTLTLSRDGTTKSARHCHRDPDRQRDGTAPMGVGRAQPRLRGPPQRRQSRLCVSAGHRGRRLHVLQPDVLPGGRQGCVDRR